ncbi:chitin synthase Chs2 [Schizosaccharomyces cryophilus OY26]|uniref:Chitin synthase n=1 Tax=Schizosaccharomyces cryophilus (strain OY26 / ATCC MYA-4695 / CBS 11777 / NBRC 106824 / NRRL Y48691) TaxID=653667 RepID=S9VTM6_SCHCR|nr:chitin synthase Chs2 [Schizosaccharomyces cryophilus OY26]EPY49395.1 chitin synthase Chs2 [Schizosaccharomyces cryophilus OY26]
MRKPLPDYNDPSIVYSRPYGKLSPLVDSGHEQLNTHQFQSEDNLHISDYEWDNEVTSSEQLEVPEEDTFSFTNSVYDVDSSVLNASPAPPIPPVHRIGIDHSNSSNLYVPHNETSIERSDSETLSGGSYADKKEELIDEDEYAMSEDGFSGLETASFNNSSAYHEMQEVPIMHDSLVVECPCPLDLKNMLGSIVHTSSEESNSLRYTAVTCNPEDMMANELKVRTNLFDRDIQAAICLTVGQEDLASFALTLSSVMENVKHLTMRKKSRVWGDESWKKVLTCIVLDGRNSVHRNILDLLSSIGAYQPSISKGRVNGKRVLAHMYEFTSTISVDEKLNITTKNDGNVPMQLLVCLKEMESGTHDSQRWFLKGISSLVRPNICLFVKVGSKLQTTSVYHAWKSFDVNSKLGGICGKTVIKTGKWGKKLLSPLIASQHCDQMIYNNLRLPYDSCLGYISNTSNALYGFRYVALLDEFPYPGPLTQYFARKETEGQRKGILKANAYVAQEQLLFWKVVTKKEARWYLNYVPQAQVEVKAPESMAKILEGRRGDINSRFSLAIYILSDFFSLWKTRHSFFRFLMIAMQVFIFGLERLFGFFSLANFFLSFHFICNSTSYKYFNPYGSWGQVLFLIFEYIFLCAIFSQFVLAMGNRSKGSKTLSLISLLIFTSVMIYYLFCIFYVSLVPIFIHSSHGYDIFGDNYFTNVMLPCLIVLACYIFVSIISLDPLFLLTCLWQYVLILPARIYMEQVYALCHLHDASTLNDLDVATSNDLTDTYRNEKKKKFAMIAIPNADMLNSIYNSTLRNFSEDSDCESGSSLNRINANSVSRTSQDYYQDMRTRYVLVWALSNLILAIILLQVFKGEASVNNGYLKFVFWTFTAFICLKTVGSTCFSAIVNLASFGAYLQRKFD